MSQESIKIKLDKINSLFEVFLKEGINKTSKLERELLKVQLKSLIKELDNIKGLDELEELSFDKQEDINEVEEVAKIIDQEINAETKADAEEIIEIEEVEQEISIETETEEPKQEEVQQVEEQEEVEKASPKTEKVSIQFINEDKEEITEPIKEVKEFSDAAPTRKLQEIIDLNKSFIFKAELFDNKNEEYKQFIDKLNTLETEESSFKFVEDYATQKAWDKEEKVYELLLRAVEKRFLPLI